MIVLDAVRLCLLTTHLLGMASIVGPFLAQMRHRTGFATGIMLGGAIVQMVTGVALFGVRHATDLDVNYAKITVKLGIALAVLFAAILAARAQKREDNVKPLFHTAGGLAVVNVLVATLWP